MVKRILRKIGVFSLGKIYGVIGAVMDLIFGTIITIMSLALGSGMGNHGGAVGLIFGVGSIIVLPIFYGIFGFIAGLIVALVFNVVSGVIGGLEVEVE
jgi:hypothetical protein